MIYAFTGKKRSGKSTASDYLQTKIDAERINFKDPLITEAQENFPDLLNAIRDTLDETDYNGMELWSDKRLFDEKPRLIRTLLQNYGTNVRRNDDPEYWTKRWIDTVETKERNIIVDDVRFINEADAVRDKGGILIRIVKNGQVDTDTHDSEVEMDKIEVDYTITADPGDTETIYKKLDEILQWTS